METTVTFDFDHTLLFETGEPNEEGIAFFREHMAAGDTIHVVTSRHSANPFMVQEIHDFLREHELVAAGVHFTEGKLKLETLKKLGSTKHFDDDEMEIEELPKHGIEAVMVFNEEKWQEHVDSL